MAENTVDDEREDQEDGQPDATNVEERLLELEKLLKSTKKERDDERSRASGLDRKVTDQAAEIKTLAEKDLTSAQLIEQRRSDLEKEKAEWAASVATQTAELEAAQHKILKQDTLNGIENFPMRFANRIHGETKEDIELDARTFMNEVQREVEPITNARKTTGAPRAGGNSKAPGLANMLPADALKLGPADMKRWSAQATPADVQAFLELRQAQK